MERQRRKTKTSEPRYCFNCIFIVCHYSKRAHRSLTIRNFWSKSCSRFQNNRVISQGGLMFPRQNRRQFIAAAAAAGAGGLLLPRLESLAQAQANPRRIDVHHHLISPAWKKQLTKWNAVKPIQGYETHQSYDPDKDIAAMDKDGVQKSFLSVTTPGMWFGDIDETRRVVREQN